MDIVQWLQSTGVWTVVTQYPWVIVMTIVATVPIVWGVAVGLHKKTIDTQAATIKLIETERDALRSQLGAGVVNTEPTDNDEEHGPVSDFLKPEPFIIYDRAWEKVSGFYLWQAAWLWIGQEPRPRIRSGSAVYPVYSMLKQAALNGDLHYTPDVQGGPPNTRALVKRSDLRLYADVYADKIPPFLLDQV